MRILAQRHCTSCSLQVLKLFLNGFAPGSKAPKLGGDAWRRTRIARVSPAQTRRFTAGWTLRASVEGEAFPEDGAPKTAAQMGAIVRQARQTFGETLPADFLSPEEYKIYERLYGPPSAITNLEDADLLQGVEEEDLEIDDLPGNVLMRENEDGKLEEVLYDEGEEREEDLLEDEEPQDDVDVEHAQSQEEFRGRIQVFRDIAAANAAQTRAEEEAEKAALEELREEADEDEEMTMQEQDMEEEEEAEESEADNEYERSDSVRTHPLTAAGRFSTSPATLQIPKDTVVDPIAALLADASNKQLKEVAQRAFGGPGLPNSTATVAKGPRSQQPIALEASQFKMGEMEGNAYLAAIMPGAYATVMSTLVEVRKRLGSRWLRHLMEQKDGPRILDAGAGGAGVLAWRKMLDAEWESMHPKGIPRNRPAPYGKSTVVTGSSVLRTRASQLLDNTTFIPRLPDYNPSRDHPSLEDKNPQPRKQYDIIVAPHTLWTLKEDYMRKNQIQNFWSLLEPKGGTLVLIEKGVPRGFELIAGARETLLKHHISSPGSEEVEYTIDERHENRFGPKEKGMIIAPCTNHAKCPMYITAGKSIGRKDFCHFSQRYIRPPYLQRILGNKDRNHEDIKFSYIALQRGVDQRQDNNFEQGKHATDVAFTGYENELPEPDSSKSPSEDVSNFNTLSLPRAILPPIKRQGHIILDLCTPAGKIERWTVPKSFSKQAYRDARKSKWGDLWALGAKTRTQRNIRVGRKKEKSKMEQMDDLGEDGSDEVPQKRGVKGKPTKRERVGRAAQKHKKRVMSEDEL